MKSITIKGQKRENVGKASTRTLRNADQVPCVVYGGDEPLHFSTHTLSFKDLVYTSDAHTVSLELDSGEKINAILQDIQFHPVTDNILHADFYELKDDRPVTMSIPIRLEGRSKGVANGGVLRFAMRKLKVRAIPAKLPDEIKIDITPLKIGNKFYVKELRTDDYTLLHPDNAVVVAVKTSRNVVVAGDDDEDEEGEEGTATDSSEESAGGGEE